MKFRYAMILSVVVCGTIAFYSSVSEADQSSATTQKDKIKKKSRQERAAEEIQAIVAQPGPAADGHERTSSGRASKPPRRPGDDAEYSVHNGYM